MSETDNAPAWRGKHGRYEVWFLTMSDGRVGYWLRYTLHAPEGGRTEGRVWFARFRRQEEQPVLAVNAPAADIDVAREPPAVRLGDAEFTSGRAAGSVSEAGHEVAWQLEFPTGDETYALLPRSLSRTPLATTRAYAPNPTTRFSGRIVIDGDEHVLDGVPGQQGHLHGTRHAERWAWTHCSAFAEDADAVVQGLVAQGRRGPLRTPFLTFVGVRRGGEWLRFSKVSRRRDYGLGVWRIDASSRSHRLTGRVAGDPRYLVLARYEDPDGDRTPRFCHHTDVASSKFVLFERRRGGDEEVAVLTSEGTTQAEWVGRTPAPGDFTEHLRVEDM